MFRVKLSQPNGCKLGGITEAIVTIETDDEVTSCSDVLSKYFKVNMDHIAVGKQQWKEQFKDAIFFPEDADTTLAKVGFLLRKHLFYAIGMAE